MYTSEARGSDESGEGTYKVPFKTVMKVGNRVRFRAVKTSVLSGYFASPPPVTGAYSGESGLPPPRIN